LFSQNNDDYYVQKKLYTYVDGLPGRTVRYVTQDGKGFMWFITNNGLCRFDGKNFKVLTQQTDGLYNNNISSITSDKGQGLIVTYFEDKSKYTISHEHVDVIDINTLKCRKLKEHYKTGPFNENEVNEVRPDPDEKKVLWFLKPYYNLQIETFAGAKVWRLDAHNNFTPKKIKAIKAIDFTRDGQNIKASVEPYSFSMPLSDHAAFIFEDSSVMCRLGYGATLCYKDNVGGYVIRYNDSLTTKYFYFSNYNSIKEIDPNDKTYPDFVFDTRVHYVTNRMDYTGVIFLRNKSLYLYRNKNELITLIDSTGDEKIRKAQILSAFRDSIGNYWISTSEGALKVTVRPKKFHHLFSSEQIPFGLNNSTRGLYRSRDGLLVAAFDFIGIKKDNTTTVIKNYYNFSFCEAGNKLWVAANDLETHELKLNKKERKQPPIFGEFWSLFPLDTNRLLFGSADGFGIYNMSNNTLNRIDTGKFRKPNITYKFFKYQGNILAVSSNGIYVINKKGEIKDCYNKEHKESGKRLLAEELNDLHIDENGLYWMCTAFDGLYCWDRRINKWEQFGVEHGFLSTTHYRIEEDDFDNLWISTEFGLAKFNKKTKHAKVFTEIDGISHNEFNRTSSFKDLDGSIYFGGMNGVTWFNPKEFFEEENTQNYPFVVNSLSLYNSRTNLMEDHTKTFYSNNQIVLDGVTRNASLEVALLDLEDRSHVYGYLIEGLDKEWNYIKEGSIKLNNLPYGNYILKIKAQCLNGLWNKTELHIPVIILIPFYRTWWFIGFALIVAVMMTLFFIKQRTKVLQKQNEKLERTVEARTVELKESLAEQIALLQEVHHRVKNNLQFIAAMLKMQINAVKDEGNQAVLKETSRRINSMSLVHEMLYNKEKLEYVSTKEYLAELVSKLNEMVYDTHEPIKFKLSIEDIKFDINNCVAIGMITSEIISNSIKYAFKNVKNPTITISLSYHREEGMVLYIIDDNGAGILNGSDQSGLGMRLIDIFSRQMEAEYEYKNDHGLKYTFKIPYEKK
jgi:two-component sensor histidine kinase